MFSIKGRSEAHYLIEDSIKTSDLELRNLCCTKEMLLSSDPNLLSLNFQHVVNSTMNEDKLAIHRFSAAEVRRTLSDLFPGKTIPDSVVTGSRFVNDKLIKSSPEYFDYSKLINRKSEITRTTYRHDLVTTLNDQATNAKKIWNDAKSSALKCIDGDLSNYIDEAVEFTKSHFVGCSAFYNVHELCVFLSISVENEMLCALIVQQFWILLGGFKKFTLIYNFIHKSGFLLSYFKQIKSMLFFAQSLPVQSQMVFILNKPFIVTTGAMIAVAGITFPVNTLLLTDTPSGSLFEFFSKYFPRTDAGRQIYSGVVTNSQSLVFMTTRWISSLPSAGLKGILFTGAENVEELTPLLLRMLRTLTSFYRDVKKL